MNRVVLSVNVFLTGVGSCAPLTREHDLVFIKSIGTYLVVSRCLLNITNKYYYHCFITYLFIITSFLMCVFVGRGIRIFSDREFMVSFTIESQMFLGKREHQ